MKTHSNYEVFEEIGRSARTVVYAGYNQMTKRNVAIKEVADATDPDQVRSLQDTARFLAELPDYTHIIEVKDLIPENGWLVLDRMRESLADRLTRENRGMSADLVRSVLRQTLRGLSVLHEAGRWVGNIRPSNLLVNDDGQVKIGDSPGLVADGVVRAPDGRSKYLAPERIEASFGEVGPWTDLYNLGFAALELLKGPKFDDLFTGTGADAINPDVGWMRVHGSKVEKTPLAATVIRGLPSDLSRVIDRMLQKEVSKRYASAEAALADLGGGDEDIPLPTDSGSEPVSRSATEPTESKPTRAASSAAERSPAPRAGVDRSSDGETKKKKPWVFIAIAGGLGLLLLALALMLLPPDDPEAAKITIETTPAGAKVTLLDVNKELKLLTPGPFAVAIKDKPRPIRLELDGHEPHEMEIDPAKTTKYEVVLKPVPPVVEPLAAPKIVQVTVATNAPGARLVWRDAETAVPVPIDSGPFGVEVKDKPRQATIELPGYDPIEIVIDPSKQKQYKFDLKPSIVPDTAIAIQITSKPEAGCAIVVDDKPEGKTPRTLMLIPGRSYRIGVARPGGEPEVRTIEVLATDRNREYTWNFGKGVDPKSADTELATDLQACDDWIRRGKPLVEYLKIEAPGKFARWRKGADAGNIPGSILVAHCLSEGVGTMRDEAAAVELYRKAATHPTSAYWLGVMHDDGKGGLKQDVVEAAKMYQKAADGGYALAMYALGRMRQTGRDGGKKDELQAADWYRKAAAADHPAGTYNLAVMTEIGLGVPQDEKAAFELYRKAVSLDYPSAMNNLGLMYRVGKGTEKDEVKAAELFRKAADLGNREGMSNLGQAFLKGTSIEEQLAAAEWFRKAAAAGHPGAMTNIGVLYLTGKGGVKVDEGAALEWFRKGAAAGHPGSMHNLGLMNQAGRGGLKPDDTEAFAWFTKGAEAGEPNSMNSLGVMHQLGRGGLKVDEATAVEWFRKAAKLGNRDAMYNLGQVHVNKKSLAEQVTAVEWYTKAVELGHPAAMNNLAVMHQNGKGGLKPDDAKAVELYQKSADLKYPPAMFNLGFMYELGRGGLTANDATAVDCYNKSAAANYEGAMYHLGMLYLAGKAGLAKDEMKAAEWFLKAATAEHDGAMYQLGLMYQMGTGGRPKDEGKAAELFKRAAAKGNKAAKDKVGS